MWPAPTKWLQTGAVPVHLGRLHAAGGRRLERRRSWLLEAGGRQRLEAGRSRGRRLEAAAAKAHGAGRGAEAAAGAFPLRAAAAVLLLLLLRGRACRAAIPSQPCQQSLESDTCTSVTHTRLSDISL